MHGFLAAGQAGRATWRRFPRELHFQFRVGSRKTRGHRGNGVQLSMRKTAKDTMDIGFEVEDLVVYPTHGVGRITGIEAQEIAGQKLNLLVIQFEKDRMTLRVPVAKAKTSGLRKLSTKKEMQTALLTLKGRSRIKRTMWSRRAQEYEAKINSGDPRHIAEVVRDLHRNAGQPDQSFSERQMYQAALDRLSREFAAVEKIAEDVATQRLEAMLKAA